MSQSGGSSGQPANLGHKDEEFDKIFHSERFDPAALNPQGAGDIDQRQKYFRVGDDPAAISEEAAASPWRDEGRQPPASELPLDGHSRSEFMPTYAIITKKKSRHRKNSDSEEAPAGGKKAGGSGRRRKVSQHTPMPPIIGGGEEEQEDLSYIQGIQVDYEQEEDLEEDLEDKQKKENSG